MDIKDFSENGSTRAIVPGATKWWRASKSEMAQAIVATVTALQRADSRRMTQFDTSTRLYGNVSLMGVSGLSGVRLQPQQSVLKERISYNIVQSGIDTITSKMIKNKPKPLFLTSGGSWKAQRRAEKLSKFVDGIFYENKAYDLGRAAFRDAGVLGDGLIQVLTKDGRVKYERVLPSELLVDEVEAYAGDPRQLHRTKNVDRDVLMAMFPEKKATIRDANPARTGQTGAYNTISNQVTVCESWHLPSGIEATDGLRAVVLEDAVLETEEWKRPYFPFARMPWSPRLSGYWSQSAAEQLQNIQLEINKLLWVIQRAMHMAGTFKILAERGSQIVKSHFTNDFGVILEYNGTPPQYIIPPIVPPEVYSHLATLKAQGFESIGVSMLSATAQKPAGLNAGKALREYQDIESERFQTIGQQYESLYLQLSMMSVDEVKEIFEREKSYEVRLPGKKFLETIDWKDVRLDDDEYTQKIFPVSSLPTDPAGRLSTIQEYAQAGYMSPRTARRLLDFPDLEQAETMANAQEDWLHRMLERMIDDGKPYNPEPEDNLDLAKELALEYISYAKLCNVEDERVQLLRDFLLAVNAMSTLARTATPPLDPNAPQAAPEPPPTSDLLPNAAGGAAA